MGCTCKKYCRMNSSSIGRAGIWKQPLCSRNTDMRGSRRHMSAASMQRHDEKRTKPLLESSRVVFKLVSLLGAVITLGILKEFASNSFSLPSFSCSDVVEGRCDSDNWQLFAGDTAAWRESCGLPLDSLCACSN